MSELNPFKIAQSQLDVAAERLGLDLATHDLLRWPQQELRVTLPVQMDDGKVKIFHAYRVQYNTARGPAKGGIRWHPEETIDTIRALGCLDDLEDGGGGYPPGRGKGRRHLQSKMDVGGREAAFGSRLYEGHRLNAIGFKGCSCSRCLYDSSDYGLDDGRV